MSILVIIGTKAQFIKMAPVLNEFDRQGIEYKLVYTGQHSETFDALEKAFGTRPADDVMVPSFEADTKLSFASWTARFWIHAIARIIRGRWRGAKLCLVHGDTASTLFGAIAARLAGIKVGHVEAGLRSPKLFDPFPEELIRRCLSRITSVHYAPDELAVRNLQGVRGKIVNTSGNTLRDALIASLAAIPDRPQHGGFGGYGVVSIHRNENLSSQEDFNALMECVIDAASVLPMKFVLHPATRAKINSTGWFQRLAATPGLQLMERVDYPNFVRLLVGSCLLMTDGGSNQEEAAMLGLPTLLLRRNTERADGLGDGVELSNLDRNAIGQFVRRLAGRTWRIRDISSTSPSRIITNSIIASWL